MFRVSYTLIILDISEASFFPMHLSKLEFLPTAALDQICWYLKYKMGLRKQAE